MKARFGCAAASGIPGLLLCLLALSLVRGARPAEPLSLTGPITSFDRAYPGCGKCFSTLLPYNWDAYKVSLKATADGSSGPPLASHRRVSSGHPRCNQATGVGS